MSLLLSGSIIPCLRWVFTQTLSASRTANASMGIGWQRRDGRSGIRSRMMSLLWREV